MDFQFKEVTISQTLVIIRESKFVAQKVIFLDSLFPK